MRGARTGKRNGKTHFNSRDKPWGKGVYEAAENLSTESDSEKFKILYIENGFPRWHSGEESPCQCRRLGLHPWVRKIPKRQPLQCSCLGNPTDRGAWWAMVHGLQRAGRD